MGPDLEVIGDILNHNKLNRLWRQMDHKLGVYLLNRRHKACELWLAYIEGDEPAYGGNSTYE